MKRGNGLPEIRKRLGSMVGGKRLDTYVPEWMKEELRQRIGEGDVIEALKIIYAHIQVWHQALKAYASTVKKVASERGMSVVVSRRSCRSKRCGTCINRYPNHYPVFLIYTNDGIKTVRTEERRDFLRKLGFAEEEITDFEACIDIHNIFWQIHNYAQLWFEKVGTKEEDKKEVNENEQRATV